jgi:hypothetical protein
MPDLKKLMPRGATEPGDMIILVNTGAAISSLIEKATGSMFTHGGLGLGQNKVIHVNGGLDDGATGKRILASFYVTDMFEEELGSTYVVFRCNDAALAQEVAIQAAPFAKWGADTTGGTGYNVSGGLGALGRLWTSVSESIFTNESTPLSGSSGTKGGTFGCDEDESVLAVAQKAQQKFFCTEWMVYMYVKTAKLKGKTFSLPIQAKDAIPGTLVDALEKSTFFRYVGAIHAQGAIRQTNLPKEALKAGYEGI